MYPKVKINLEGIKNNLEVIYDICSSKNIQTAFVTKVFTADNTILDYILKDTKLKILADSRIENIKALQKYNLENWLIRIPMKNELEEVVKYCDVSLNSELETIKELNKIAFSQNKIHSIILMIDLGDLREGYFDLDLLYKDIEKILTLKNIHIKGIGTNLTCYGAIIPKEENMKDLCNIKKEIEDKFNITLETISGGNSSTFTLIDKGENTHCVNNLRLGEVILFGRETSYHKIIKGTKEDNFILEAQIVELKEKPSLPIGEIGFDSFEGKPTFIDKGIMKRAILGIGRQDIDPLTIDPLDKDIEILGASSDHTILNLTNSKKEYKVGDIISFKLSYASTLRVMTSKYVEKEYVQIP